LTDAVIDATHLYRIRDGWTWTNVVNYGFGGSEGTALWLVRIIALALALERAPGSNGVGCHDAGDRVQVTGLSAASDRYRLLERDAGRSR
jgi:hypothetical protein